MAIAGVDHVATILRRDLTPAEVAAAAQLLELVDDRIEAETGRKLTVTTSTVTMRGNWSPELRLGYTPVVAVESIALNGEPLDEDVDWCWLGGPTVLRGPVPAAGVTVARASYHWGGPDAMIDVTYDHGWLNVPADLVDVAAQAVARALTRLPAGDGIQSHAQSIGTWSETITYEATPSTDLLADPALVERCRKYRRRGWPKRGE